MSLPSFKKQPRFKPTTCGFPATSLETIERFPLDTLVNIVLYELIFSLSIPVDVDFDQAGWLLSQERFWRKTQGWRRHVQNFFSSFCYISRFLEAMAQYMELIDVFLERKTFSLRSGENFWAIGAARRQFKAEASLAFFLVDKKKTQIFKTY